MPTLRAFDSANITPFTTATDAVSAAKPVGLAEGDLWLIIHERQNIDPAPPVQISPEGFDEIGLINNNVIARKVYAKIAEAGDVGGGPVSWTQEGVTVAQTWSIAVQDPASPPYDTSDPIIGVKDPAALNSHDHPGITPPLDGLMVVIGVNATQNVTWSAPTTQGGGWTDYGETTQASSPRLGIGVFTKARLASAGATGTITYATTGTATRALTGVLFLYTATTLDPQLLLNKRAELKQAAENEDNELWRFGATESSIKLEKERAIFEAAEGTASAGTLALLADSKAIVTTLRSKLDSANTAFAAGDATALDAVTWT